MGICQSKSGTKELHTKKHQMKIIIPPNYQIAVSHRNEVDEIKTEKQPFNENSMQHSPPNSHQYLKISGQITERQKRGSVLTHTCPKNDQLSKLQNTKISKASSSRSIHGLGSPMSARGSIQQGVIFYSTNASKKYSIITKKELQLNPDLTLVESNKTGKRARFELLDKANENSIKYILWLKSNQLEHKNIIKCKEVHQDNEVFQILYENFEGFNLSRLLNSEDLTEPTLANLAYQMLSVLKYLNTLSMVHGNLTIDSWEYRFITGQIVVKLTNIKPISAKNEVDLEMAYLIAPEQIYKEEFTSERDFTAVLMTLFILAKGRLPYQIPSKVSNDLPTVKQIILNHKFQFNIDTQKFSEGFKDLLQFTIYEKTKNKKSLNETIQHEWILNNRYPDTSIQERLLMNILNQKGICMLQQAILEIMIQEFEQETAIQLQKMVSEFDSDMDTQLTKEEFIQLFQKYTKVTDLEDKINIVYNENGIKDGLIPQFTFLALAAPRDQLLNRFNLEIVFNLLSNNKSEIRVSNITKYLNVQNEELEAQFNDLAPEKKLNLNQFTKMMELAK